MARSTRNNLASLLVYIGLSVGIFGRQVLWHPASTYVGGGPDPSQMMWFLVWWPYAILHGLNPFLTKVVWPPAGVNLAWMTPIPALSLLAFPITYGWGPVVSYNLLALIGPALSAWSAYCLCAHITQRFLPSFAGGYLYGFSSYEVGQVLGGHLGHSIVMLPPLAVLLFLLLLEKKLSHLRFTVLFTGCLFAQFLISNALFATMTAFGLLTALLAWWLSGPGLRSRLWHAVPSLLLSYLLTAIALSPYLYYVLAFGMPSKSIWPLDYYSADLVGFILPNKLCHFYFGLFGLDTHFLFDPWENGAYLSAPVLLLCGWYWLENRRKPTGKLLAIALVLILIAALGPRLHVAGTESVLLPWAVVTHLPFLKHELPGRFMLFAFLIIAVMTSIWLSQRTQLAGRLALLSFSVILLWPEVQTSAVDVPAFFTSGPYRHFLKPDENVLAVPISWNGHNMLWQAESLMYFRMIGGYLGATPMEFEHWPIVQALFSSILMPNVDDQLKDFLGHYDVEAVLLDNSAKGPWRQVFSVLDPSPVSVGGVTIYRVRTGELGAFRHTDAEQADGRANLTRFSEMLWATSQYLRKGLDPAKLNCARAQELGLMPDRGESFAASNQLGWCYSMWFGPMGGDNIGIGLIGYYAGLKPVIERYAQYTSNIFYPYPQKMSGNQDADELGTLMIIFNRKQLALAAAASNEVVQAGLTDGAGVDQSKPSSRAEDAVQTEQPPSSAQADTSGPVASNPTLIGTDNSPGRPLPVITAVNGTPVSGGENSGRGVVEPVMAARRARWVPWWRETQTDNVMVIDGHGFDTNNGVALDLYCACPGGKLGPFLFAPGADPFTDTKIFLKLPLHGDGAPPPGPGSIVVRNKGGDGQYVTKSNQVPIAIR